MKTPPFLLLGTLVFWGWQSGLLVEGAIMGVVLESTRFIRWRWELDDTDFNRIFTFCILLNVLLAGYVFSTNDEGGGLGAMFHGNAVNKMAGSSLVTFTRSLRWLPMTTFAFIAAQFYNVRDSVPLTSVSPMLRWRRRKGDQSLKGKYLNVSYAYFIICLFSAGYHSNTGTHTYFWGESILVVWALWNVRSRRFLFWVWAGCLVLVMGLGFLGQFGISQAQNYIQNFNAQWMSRFLHPRTDAARSVTSIGQIGNLKLSAEIVVWLEPHDVGRVPQYLREATYRVYHAQRGTWYAGTHFGMRTGGGRSEFAPLVAEPDGTSWILLSDKTNAVKTPATVNISCFLNGWSSELSAPEGLLPLPSGVRRLDNTPENMIFKENRNGAVLAAGPGVMSFDATYAGGGTIDSPPTTNQEGIQLDLLVPTSEMPALDQVIAGMNVDTNNDVRNADLPAKLRTIDRFFLNHFSYTTWQGPDKLATTNRTALTRFLLTSRSGHCEYFATATVLLLRELNVPARYAVGYAVHENSGTGYVVRDRDAHAWCLVWDAKARCWEDFDTTPPSWVTVEGKRTAFMEWLVDLKSRLLFQIGAFRWRQAHLQQYIFWALIPVIVVLVFHIIFRRRGNLKARGKGDREAERVWPGLDSEFYQLEKKLAGFGLPRQPGEPVTRWLERLSAEPALAELREPLRKLVRLHYRHRFDPQGLSAAERAELKLEARKCLDALLVEKAH